MSTSVQRAVQFANPTTGEVLTLDAPDKDLARYLDCVREFEAMIREHKRMVNDEIIRRLDDDHSWTRHLEGGLTISAPSPEPKEEFDAAALRTQLEELANQGHLTIDAVNRAVEIVVDYKVRADGIKKLRKGGGLVAEIVDQHCQKVDKVRYVRVKRT